MYISRFFFTESLTKYKKKCCRSTYMITTVGFRPDLFLAVCGNWHQLPVNIYFFSILTVSLFQSIKSIQHYNNHWVLWKCLPGLVRLKLPHYLLVSTGRDQTKLTVSTLHSTPLLSSTVFIYILLKACQVLLHIQDARRFPQPAGQRWAHAGGHSGGERERCRR